MIYFIFILLFHIFLFKIVKIFLILMFDVELRKIHLKENLHFDNIIKTN